VNIKKWKPITNLETFLHTSFNAGAFNKSGVVALAFGAYIGIQIDFIYCMGTFRNVNKGTVFWKGIIRVIAVLIVSLIILLPYLTIPYRASTFVLYTFKFMLPFFVLGFVLFSFIKYPLMKMNLLNFDINI